MKKLSVLFVFAILAVACAHLFQSPKLNDKDKLQVALKLGEMVGTYQAARCYAQDKTIEPKQVSQLFEPIDEKNLRELKLIIEKYGWIKSSDFGETASHNASLLAQHADADMQFQEYCLGLMENAVKTKDAPPTDFAYLWDRVKSKKKEPQRFGTQGACKGKNQWEPFPIEEPGKLEERRKAFGMVSFTEYLKQISESCP